MSGIRPKKKYKQMTLLTEKPSLISKEELESVSILLNSTIQLDPLGNISLLNAIFSKRRFHFTVGKHFRGGYVDHIGVAGSIIYIFFTYLSPTVNGYVETQFCFSNRGVRLPTSSFYKDCVGQEIDPNETITNFLIKGLVY